VLQNGNTEQAACVRRAIEAGGREDLPEVLAAIRATGALEYARQKARIEAESELPPRWMRFPLLNTRIPC
jgi:octaprenyl-diphosphate synthase